jgi:hypothetical protein
VCDIAIVCHIAAMCEMFYSLPILEAPLSGRQPKLVVVKEKNKTLRPRVSRGWPPGPHIFIDL